MRACVWGLPHPAGQLLRLTPSVMPRWGKRDQIMICRADDVVLVVAVVYRDWAYNGEQPYAL